MKALGFQMKRRPARRLHALLALCTFLIVFVILQSFHNKCCLDRRITSHSVVHPQRNAQSQSRPHADAPTFQFSIKVLAYNRTSSLLRCLNSLKNVDYAGHNISLDIFIDHSELSTSLLVLQLAQSFDWTHGRKSIHFRSRNVGTGTQWLESWWPTSDTEYALFIEDDLEVSPFIYRTISHILSRPVSDDVYGISLQRNTQIIARNLYRRRRLDVPSSEGVYMYRTIGTWGHVMFPKPWLEFRIWYEHQRHRNVEPIVEGLISTDWYRVQKSKIWTPYWIRFIFEKGWYSLYFNFPHSKALSVSYREKGVNTHLTMGRDAMLVDKYDDVLRIVQTKVDWSNMYRYDYCGYLRRPGKVATSFKEVQDWLDVYSTTSNQLYFAMADSSHIDDIWDFLCFLNERAVFDVIVLAPGNNELASALAKSGYFVYVGTDSASLIANVMKLSFHAVVMNGSDPFVVPLRQLPLEEDMILFSNHDAVLLKPTPAVLNGLDKLWYAEMKDLKRLDRLDAGIRVSHVHLLTTNSHNTTGTIIRYNDGPFCKRITCPQ